MLTFSWLRGLVLRRPGRFAGVAVGVALTVALLATLGAFSAASGVTMTTRAIADVPVDWQVLLAPGANAQQVAQALNKSTGVSAVEPVGYADSMQFSATTGSTTQTTGAGKVLGLTPAYFTQFAAELRALVGAKQGVLVAQQTAANLHVVPGDMVTIARNGIPAVDVRVDGVVELPYADSLFQAVGVPAGTAPQAPPDNVIVVPAATWHALFDPQARVRPDSVHTQLHVRLAHDLPPDPVGALTAVEQRARNFEARIAGSGIVGNNLAARLSSVRQDALYASVLLLFLGLPGAILAMLLTGAVAATGATRRRQEQALLRVRGASSFDLIWLAASEALLAGMLGVVAGLALALGALRLLVPDIAFDSALLARWLLGSALVGILLALAAIALPAWRATRTGTVATARRTVGRGRVPVWERCYLDVLLLAGAGIMVWRTAGTGYQIVLAAEGVAQTAVAYEAFLAPLGLWVGAALLTLRLWRLGLLHGRGPLAALLQPIAGGLSATVAAALSRERARVVRGVVLVALAIAFALSTAVFNTTYNAQSRVDAELTNGADVQVQGTTASPPGAKLAALAALPGVVAAQPVLHRFAYVGADLQDIFGIDPTQIDTATHMANAYFANGDAHATLAALAQTSDGILVSQETVNDFQLTPGDTLNLRLQFARDQNYHLVPFHFIGVTREFPTAPKDSFLVVNAKYLAQQTGTPAAEIVLLRVSGDAVAAADRARAVVAALPGAHVTDIIAAQRTISSSLTAVDLRGLTALELVFALILAAAATGLVFALNGAERRRSFALLVGLGARTRQLGAFVWSEGLFVLGSGVLVGGGIGVAVAWLLVTMLTHVFDPPPETLVFPWGYLLLVLIAGVLATAAAVVVTQYTAQRGVTEIVREGM